MAVKSHADGRGAFTSSPALKRVTAREVPRPLIERVRQTLQRSVEHCLSTQKEDGSWEALPDPRIFETALVGYALSCSPGGLDVRASELASRWVASAQPQEHSPVAYLLESVLRDLVLGQLREVDLMDPQLTGPVFSSRTALLYMLCLHAGVRVVAPFDEQQFRLKVERSYAESQAVQLKQWSRVDLISMHLLLQRRAGHEAVVEEALAQLVSLQGAEGDFFFNPVSTALAYIALSEGAPGSAAWRRCRDHLLRSQRPDGTWRFCTSDIWDTALTVRSFRAHPLFMRKAFAPAREFLVSRQNVDGGWAFRSCVESDNDTTSMAMLALAGTEQGDRVAPRAVEYFAQRQLESGLWRTWQFKHDPPVEDVVAHVVSALSACKRYHDISLRPAREWLAEQYRGKGYWEANWYRGLPYAVVEVLQALDPSTPEARQAIAQVELLQNPDGGWGPEPRTQSLPSTTGLMLAALTRHHASVARLSILRALQFLVETQREDGSWDGRPEMCGPRPLLTHFHTHTQAFATYGLLNAWAHMSK
jgi:squalene-hopene/tetraprenyl-beta-curcumene cyclase